MTAQSTVHNVLIIGGSGFLSGTVARRAVTRGYDVWTVTRGQRSLPEGTTGLIADRHDEAAFERAITQAQTRWDLVIDCIAFKPDDIRQDVALLGPLARHLVFVSTDFVYDPDHRRFPQPEEAGHYAAQGYGYQKRLCELELIGVDPGALSWTIVRPCHIYGPGSNLGCLPLHSRDPDLIAQMKAGKTLKLVGGGHFLQQPILAGDLADLLLNLGGNENSYGQLFNAAGPDVIESRTYYRIVANILGVDLQLEEIPVGPYL